MESCAAFALTNSFPLFLFNPTLQMLHTPLSPPKCLTYSLTSVSFFVCLRWLSFYSPSSLITGEVRALYLLTGLARLFGLGVRSACQIHMIVPGLVNGASEANANPPPMSVIPVDRNHTMTVPKSNQVQIKAVSGKR